MKRARKEHVFSIIHDFGENVNLRKRKLEKGLGVFLADFRFRNFPKPIDKARRSCYNRQRSRACSSVGRALRSQRRGRGFESHQVHRRFRELSFRVKGPDFCFRRCPPRAENRKNPRDPLQNRSRRVIINQTVKRRAADPDPSEFRDRGAEPEQRRRT